MKRREKNMKKVLSCALALSLLTGGTAFASGYRIPVQSIDSTAKSGANVASASSADAAFDNPAGMSFLPKGWLVEVDGTYLHLTSVKYTDDISPLRDGHSKVEDYFIPTLFVVSPEVNNLRFGFSVTTPYGMGKRWTGTGMDNMFPGTYASKFELRVTDFNPTVTYALTDKLSIAGGVRLLYASATLANNSDPYTMSQGETVNRFLDGDTTGYGYNLAIDYKPSKEWNFAATYRSKVDLNFKGDVLMSGMLDYNTVNPQYPPGSWIPMPGSPYRMKGKVTVIAPAVAALSTAYSWDKFTFELTVDRTFWSAYNQLNFTYQGGDSPMVSALGLTGPGAPFGPVEKNWKDANAIRLGLEYNVIKPLTLMAGICYDQSGAPDSTLGFELPDSSAWSFSLGARYAVTDRLDVGVAALYDTLASRSVSQDFPSNTNPDPPGETVNGKFSDSDAVLVTVGIKYRF